MSIALCPGSYDPPTRGHLDILKRVATIFPHVVAVVAVNPAKQGLLPPATRASLLQAALQEVGVANVSVEIHGGLVVDAARQYGANTIVKGIRDGADWAYEAHMARANRDVGGLETVLVPASPEYSHVSSSLVKELARHGVAVGQYVTDNVAAALNVALREEKSR